MTLIIYYLFSFLILRCHAIRFNSNFGYERPLGVLPSVFNTDDQQSTEILSQDATDREVDSNRQARQIFFPSFSQSLFSDRFNQRFRHFVKPSPSPSPQRYQRKPRKTIPYYYNSGQSSRYQSTHKTTLAHKKRQQNPYYGRKKRNAEPYTLLDPTTGRNIEQEQNDVIPDLSPPKKRQNFLFGLPLDFFSDGEIKENVRFQRRVPPQQQESAPIISTPSNSYLASNGVPLYKYRQKYPQGYSGRRKRHAPSPPWTLLDPVTGHSITPNNVESNSGFNQLEQQFNHPETRLTRNPEVYRAYLDQTGSPIYRHHKRYPYTG